MTIEQDIFKFYEKLTDERVVNHFHYKSFFNIQFKIIIIGIIVLILLTVCMLIRSMLPILEMSKFLILWIAIVDAIIIFIMLFVTKECHIVINKQKEKVNLDSIKQEAIYLYLIKQKYILKNRDNSCFYSSVLQFIQFNSTKFYDKSFFACSITLISIGLSILSLILDENANMLIKLASALLVISICISMAIIFHSLMLNSSLRYKRLYSLILSIRLKDSIKRKNEFILF